MLQDVGISLLEALTTHGFIYIKDHGIPPEITDKAFKASKDFFSLPGSVKESSFPIDKQTTVGYKRAGLERLDKLKEDKDVAQAASFENRETFQLFRFHTDALPGEDVAPGFQPALGALFRELKRLVERMDKCLASALGLEDGYFEDIHGDVMDEKRTGQNLSSLRACYYPSISGDVGTNNVFLSQ